MEKTTALDMEWMRDSGIWRKLHWTKNKIQMYIFHLKNKMLEKNMCCRCVVLSIIHAYKSSSKQN